MIILDLINKNENVSGEQFAEKFALSDRMIDKDLAFLKKIGLIVYEGSKKSGDYRVTNKFREFLEDWSNKI